MIDNIQIESPETVVPLNSKFYIERKQESRGYEEIERERGLVIIRGKRKTGKTSYMIRLIDRAKSLRYRLVIIDFRKTKKKESLIQLNLFFFSGFVNS